jgi:hypothetical protein
MNCEPCRICGFAPEADGLDELGCCSARCDDLALEAFLAAGHDHGPTDPPAGCRRCREVGPVRPWRGRRAGRPRKVTPQLLEQAQVLRKEGLTWREVGQRLSSSPGTLRRSTQRARSARRPAQNAG